MIRYHWECDVFGNVTSVDPAVPRYQGVPQLFTLLFLCVAVPQSALCFDTPECTDDSSIRWEQHRYSHEVCLLHSSRPRATEFAAALQSAGVATNRLSRVGHVWLLVSERDWHKARAIAKNLDFSMLPADGPIACSSAYPDSIRVLFFEGNWREIQKQLVAIQDADVPAENPAVVRAIDECRHRIQLEEDKVLMPTSAEWQKISEQLSRRQKVEYLLRRVALSRADCVVNGLPIPSSVEKIAFQEIRGKRYELQGTDDSSLIDPLLELYSMRLAIDELQPVVAMLTRDHTFVPVEGLPQRQIRLIPASRYCYCVLINSVLGNCNSLREYDLSEVEWQDSTKVAAKIDQLKGALPNRGK